jgi:putative endonuclease
VAGQYFVYILSSSAGLLYIGVTKDLARRMQEHRDSKSTGYAGRFAISRLIYFEATSSARDAIAREKQLKGWRRAKKLALVRTLNPTFRDLADEL